MKVATLGFVVLLSAPAPVALAQISGDVSVGVYATTAPGEPVGSVDVFYDQLSPYGVWVDDPDGGSVFVPDRADYVPYTNGHWAYTDLGFVWVSDEPFAWATAHYGRWYFSSTLGRWAWMPDTTWGPSWVQWTETDGDYGWAPLAPQFVIDRGYQPPVQAWHYCPAERVLDANVTRYYEPPQRVEVIHRQARPIQRVAQVNNTRVIVGPAPERLREHHVQVRPTRVEPRTIGRLSPTEARTAVTRAQQRRPEIDQQNRQRLEQHRELRDKARAPSSATRTQTRPQPATPAPTPRREHPSVAPETHHDQTRERAPRQEPQTIQPRHEMKTEPAREPHAVEPTRPEPPRAQPHPESARPQPPAHPEQPRVAPHGAARPATHGKTEKRRDRE